MIRARRKHNISDEENVFWVTMSDLLLGLLITFIVLFVFAITGFTQNKVESQKIKLEVGKQLAKEFKKNNINVEVDKITGKIKISDLELFEFNQWQLSPKGRHFLNKFLPIYFNTILGDPNIKKYISQVIIEGHTDSYGFWGAKSTQENYVRNMELSTKRANSVASYVIYINFPKKKSYEKDLMKLMSVNGKGSTDPVLVNGKEDYKQSRRVELKILFKDDSVVDYLKKNVIKN